MIAAPWLGSCDEPAPFAPDVPMTAAVTSVRYERTKSMIVGGAAEPVVATLWYALGPGDPYERTSARLCVLERTGLSTFVCLSPRFEGIPVDREWSAFVNDPAVAAHSVARDLYLNGVRVRVETSANGTEVGVFRIDVSGRVS